MLRDDHNALPLSLRTRPLPWEDIGSLLSRVARRMSYEQPSWLLRPESGRHRIRAADLPVLARRADYPFFERLLLLDQETLYALTLNRFAVALDRPSPLPGFEDIHREFLLPLQESGGGYSSPRIGRPLLGEWDYRTFFLSVSSIKVCPLCLEETEAYDRLYWRTRFLITCPRHAVFLRERCPACHAAIPSLRSSPTRCPICGKGDYRTAPRSLHLFLTEASCLLAGDLLTLKALGVDGEAASGHSAAWQEEGLAPSRPGSTLACCTPSARWWAYSARTTSAPSSPPHTTRCWPGCRAAARSYRSGIPGCRSPSHTGSLTPGQTISSLCGREGDEAYSLLDQAYERYQSTFDWRGHAALIDRVQQRLNAFGDIPHASLRG